MPYLPGNTAQRLAELRSQRGLTQEQLCSEMEKAGLGFFNRSTISRVESGKVQNVSSELITALVKFFDVTADFLLGLTDIPDKKNYELSELGLSYDAARKLLLREVNPDALNRFIECESFADLCDGIARFYHSSMTEIYAKVNGLFAGIRSLPGHAEELGYSLSTDDQKHLQTDLSALAPCLDPVQAQKLEPVQMFSRVMDELAGMMNRGIDPEAMVLDDEAFRRKVHAETPGEGDAAPVLTQEEMAQRAMQKTSDIMKMLKLEKGEDRAAFLQLLNSLSEQLK